MLKKLRRKFTLFTLVLSGAVLAFALVLSYVTTYRAQVSITETLLEQSLEEGLAKSPQMGGPGPDEGTVGADSMLTITVDVTTGGVLLTKSDSPVSVDSDALSAVIQEAIDSGEASGYDAKSHLSWATKDRPFGMTIAICDTYSRDRALKQQAISSVAIFFASLTVLYFISRALANWAIKPVGEAWDQQRRFISDASHELKTPLAVIIANTQILQKDKALPEGSRRWVDSTADESSHMKGLVEDLLTLARADEAAAGSVSASGPFVDVDLTEVVEEAALEYDALAFERGCSIDCEAAQGVSVKGDRAQLSRVVNTLLDNATKYADKGTAVTLTLARDGKKTQLKINNKGAVIAAEDLEHLFDRFYRTDKARSREDTGGFGLGLAIAKSIVDAHGGKIWATSTADAGTTFHVML